MFGKSKEEIKKLAVDGAQLVWDLAKEYGPERFRFEYSPESFTGTEPDYAVEVCNAVLDVWHPTKEHPVIINLPSTVEMATPNVYADQIEYVCRHIHHREAVQISLHAHNDRGCAVAPASWESWLGQTVWKAPFWAMENVQAMRTFWSSP